MKKMRRMRISIFASQAIDKLNLTVMERWLIHVGKTMSKKNKEGNKNALR